MRLLISLFLFIFSLSLQAQVSIDFKISTDTLEVGKYKPEKLIDGKRIFLQASYGGYKIYNPKTIKKIKGKYVEKVQLIYTDYPKDADMSLLNKKRLISLYLLMPELFDAKDIKWEFVKQTDATSSTVFNYFHGFAIEYRNKPMWEYAADKKEYFEDVIAGKKELTDSTILKVFERNSDWDNMLIVSDFTGSMSPYIAELLLWLHLNVDKKKDQRFVFFNDGDNTPNDKKVIGKTGGFYYTKYNNLDSVLITAVRTIDAGSGGDAPENDVEALLFGMKKFPKHKTVILIADNGAKMRDFELISKLKRPVKVIVCGGDGSVNLQYMNLAYSTGGSIHTIEEDILNLIDLKEGETIEVGDTKFMIKNGEFIKTDD